LLGHVSTIVLTFTISPSLFCTGVLIYFDLGPVLVMSSPLVITSFLHAAAIRLSIKNENLTSTVPNLEPLFGKAEIPLPNRVVVAVNTYNLTVFKGNTSCPDSDHNPLSVSLVPPDRVV